jgi:trigger factor
VNKKLKLQVVVADLSQSKKDLSIEVPADDVKAEFERTYDVYMRHAKVPGFRPGRAPRGVIKQRFAKEAKDEVIKNLLQHALKHVINDHKLHVVGNPIIDVISISEGEPMKFKMTLEVVPEFELKEYKGLKLTKVVWRVTDKDVEDLLEGLRQSAAEFVPVEDRPSQDGDFVSVNLVAKCIEPPEEEELKTDGVQIELGSKDALPEFTENLRGVKPDDVREFRVKYPEDFASEEMAGKTFDFTATVVAVRRKELPALDDEFARDVSGYGSIQELRQKIRRKLIADSEAQAELRLRNELIERILQDYDFEIPVALVEPQTVQRAQEFAQTLMQKGFSPQAIKEINWREWLNKTREIVARDIRAEIIFAKIAKAENIEVTADEVDAEIERLARANDEPADRLKARLTKDEALSSIESSLRYRKALDAVINYAEIAIEEFTKTQNEDQARVEPEGELQSESKSA